MSHRIPAVLIFSGLDPSGGAGIQADIEALASQGCHACPLITTLTTQDTVDVKNTVTVSAELIKEQARTILDDIPVAAVKIGLVDSTDIIEAIHGVLSDLPDVPVILDPVLASGADTTFRHIHISNGYHMILKELIYADQLELQQNFGTSKNLC